MRFSSATGAWASRNTLGKDGGYILGPSHYIQAGTPPENVLALFETATSYYPYAR